MYHLKGDEVLEDRNFWFCNASQESLREAPEYRQSEKYHILLKTRTTGVIWLPPAGTIRFDPQTTNYSYFEKCRRKKTSARDNHKGKMGYEQYTVLDDCSCRTDFSTRKHLSMAPRTILSNFFEEQGTQNDPKYLSGL